MKRLIWIMVGWMALTVSVQAASFDCAKASTPQEKLICFDYRLSDLDSQLAWSYSEVLKQTKDTLALKQSQKVWVAAREKCTDVNCILHAYINRIETLAPETKLEEVYFPKAEIPWDFFPQPKYQIAGYDLKIKTLKIATIPNWSALAENKSLPPTIHIDIPEDKSEIKTTKSEAEARWIPLELVKLNNKFEPIIFNDKFLPIASPDPNKGLIELGSLRLAQSISIYGSCETFLDFDGLYVARDLPWGKNNVLVPMRPSGNPARIGNYHLCREPVDPSLHFFPAAMEPIVFNGNIYLFGDQDFVIRLDHNLQTASRLFGEKIFFGWARDLDKLTGKKCDRFSTDPIYLSTLDHQTCIDKQLHKLIGEVGRFYKSGGV